MSDSPEVLSKEQIIQSLLMNVPEEQRRTIGYGYRYLPKHMKDAGMSYEEITTKLDEINFPQELR